MQKNMETILCTEVWDIQLYNQKAPTYPALRPRRKYNLLIVSFPSLFEPTGLQVQVQALELGCLYCPPNGWGRVEASAENDGQ